MSIPKAWISPWNGKQLSPDEVIHEVALCALSKLYVTSTLGYPEPDIVIGADSVTIRCQEADYDHIMYYPKQLSNVMARDFHVRLVAIREEYGLSSPVSENRQFLGEKTGTMLRVFKSLERLIQMVSATRCWHDKRILVLHGLPGSQSVATLRNDMDAVNIHYLILHPKDDEAGTGIFKAATMDRAIFLINNLRQGRYDVIGDFFDFKRDYGRHSWVSDNTNWSDK